jgi:predicted  nucleic acid-binding Zn-ribbon protein
MSVKTNTGVQIPTEQLNCANKSTLISIIDQLTTELSDVKGQLSDTRQEVADLRGDVEESREDVDRVWKEVADTNGRVSDLEEKTDTDASQSSESDNNESDSNSDGQCTALEQVCALTEDESKEHLTANQSRAKKVACRINEYGKSVPAGVAITSSRMRDMLSGMEDKRIHRQTIQRVMDFLERFGDEHVNKKETKGGKTVVVFSKSVVERIKGVVTGNENTTVTPTIL